MDCLESVKDADLKEGTVGALPPQTLRARFILAVSLVDLQVLHLRRKGTKAISVSSSAEKRFAELNVVFVTRSKKQRPTSSGQSVYSSSSFRNVLEVIKNRPNSNKRPLKKATINNYNNKQ